MFLIDYLYNALRLRTGESLSGESLRMHRVLHRSRWTLGTVRVAGHELTYVDGASAYSAWHAIFLQKLYDFRCGHESPVIIDCGANIGIAVRYWLSRYESPKILAIEPDPAIFETLKQNCDGAANVTLLQSAVSKTGGPLSFCSTGDDAGHLLQNDAGQQTDQKQTNTIAINSAQLSELIEQSDSPIDFLKLDIEGAETEVLKEAASKLDKVRNLFVEYHGFADQQQTLHELLAVLSEAGFRYHLLPELWSPSPYQQIKIDNGMDQRVNVCASRDFNGSAI
ncbi:FkbM family methyltransferase [Stieleria sp. JC731]|uniref:FkbM family methyltransferase n=1 Tax=Pirellulaceae TaxID=2691357 RepID=UPI001E460A34|nr:FkbM family methyltransferase [Stieleria sp. JC731]MCC9599035.1 FkbM family methyltransferase [Stieleria sp. JC731]